MSAAPPRFELIHKGPGQYALAGELSFETVTQAMRQALPVFAADTSLLFDLSDLSRVDSAGLAVLLEWVRQGRMRGLALHYRNVPEQVRSMARVVGVETFLPT